jgi:hypothetical protein
MEPGMGKAVKRELNNGGEEEIGAVKREEKKPGHGRDLRSTMKGGTGKAVKKEDNGGVKVEKREDAN